MVKRKDEKRWQDMANQELLESGYGIECYTCPSCIKLGTPYVEKDGKVYCEECGG